MKIISLPHVLLNMYSEGAKITKTNKQNIYCKLMEKEGLYYSNLLKENKKQNWFGMKGA